MNSARCWSRQEISRQITIDIMNLSNDALLKIFDFFLDDNDSMIGAWHSLVHVCRKWRNIIFGSPRRLNLHIHCTAGKPQAVRELLDIWPDLPIVIKLYDPLNIPGGVDNAVVVTAPLAYTDHLCEISLGMYMVAISPLEVIFAAMKVPFPASIRLKFLPEHETAAPIAPDDSFIDGSVPHLRSLYSSRVLPLGLPKLLLSTTDLVRLTLRHIPHSGYIPPEAMAGYLSTLTSLESLLLEFEFPRPIQGRGRPAPQTLSSLPALTYFSFRGVSEYLEDIVARIDAKFLDELHITFFHQLILDTPQLAQFIGRTPNLKAHNEVQVTFLDDTGVQVLLGSMQQISIRTACEAPDWQISFVAQVCSSALSLIPSLEHLYICECKSSRSRRPDDVENDQWLELLRPFTNVKNLYLSEGVVPRIASALQELVVEGPGRVTEVLHGLESLFFEEPVDEPSLSKLASVQDAVGVFIAARGFPERFKNSCYWRGRGTSVICQKFML